MKIDNYILTSKMIRETAEIKDLKCIERGVFRDLLDLMWLSSRRSAIPDSYATIADRLNIPEKTLKSSINKLLKLNLLRLDDTPCGSYIVSPMLERQLEGKLTKMEDSILHEREQVLKIGVKASGIEKKLGLSKRFIKIEDLSSIEKYSGWIPTRNYSANGEAFVVTEDFIKELKSHAPNSNVDFILIRAYQWLINENNANRRPTYANMGVFLCRFAERFEKDFRKKKQVKSKEVQISQDDFEKEMLKLLGDAS